MFKLTCLVAALTATAVIALPGKRDQVPLCQPAKSTAGGIVVRGYSSSDCNEANFVVQYDIDWSTCYDLTMVVGAKQSGDPYANVIARQNPDCSGAILWLPYNSCADVSSYDSVTLGPAG